MAGGPLAEMFMAHRRALLRYLRARGAGDEAEDLLQELWIKLGAGTEDAAINDLLAYLYRMAHNLMLDRRRSTVRRRLREQAYQDDVREPAGIADPAAGAERTLLARDRLRYIDRALSALGTRADSIFRRHRVEGVPQRQIAEELGITLSAVEKHLQRAYRAVAAAQRSYGEDGQTDPTHKEVQDDPR
ncbi:MAG TPA: RNA polymerase sigma factor [Acetobacteraceae bacterium]|nr:RNA polymerase sigma factor [Acetobacteraceae bacterium]